MSKLVKAVDAVNTGRRFEEWEQFNSVVEISKEVISRSYATEYSIKATFGANCLVSDKALSNSDDELSHAIQGVKRSIIEAVFGEFRTDFCLIEQSLRERKIDKALELLYRLETKMFSEN